MPATLLELQLHIRGHAQGPTHISLLDTKEFPDIIARYPDIKKVYDDGSRGTSLGSESGEQGQEEGGRGGGQGGSSWSG
eukprot:4545315-Heterocapsa_arctica.AAC.1